MLNNSKKKKSENNEDKLFGWVLAGNGVNLTDTPNAVEGIIQFQPKVPGYYTLRYVDAYTKQTRAESSLFEIYESCPGDCNKHGDCFHGICTCVEGWLAPDCRRKDEKVFFYLFFNSICLFHFNKLCFFKKTFLVNYHTTTKNINSS